MSSSSGLDGADSDLRPVDGHIIVSHSQMSRLYQNLTSRLHSSLQNVNSSIHLFGNSCMNQLNRIHHPSNNNNNSVNNSPFMNNSTTSPFLNNNGIDDQNNHPSIQPTNFSISLPRVSSNHQRSSCRSNGRLGRGHHHSLSCRDREYRNAYHNLYRNGLITVRTLDKDRNVLAAVLSIIVIAILATALAQPKWFSIYNDLCVPRYFTKSSSEKVSNDETPSIFDFQTNQYIQFRPVYYYNSPSHSVYSSSYALTPVTIYGLTPDNKSCANPQILALKRTIIGLCFLAIMCTLVQFFMDTMGTRRKWVNSMRVYAIGNIVCVLLCVLVIGLCYFISVLYERVQLQQLFSKRLPSSPSAIWIKNRIISRSLAANQLDYLTIHQIEVKFELSYYLVTLAGFLSILASAANLFRRPQQIFIERISEVNNCRSSRHLRHAASGANNNSDENSLLGSDALNSAGPDSPTTTVPSNHHQNHQYTPPYPSYSPNDWLFNPNWSLFYNSHAQTNAQNIRQPSAFDSPTNHNNIAIAPPPPPISVPCPPPPPYSP